MDASTQQNDTTFLFSKELLTPYLYLTWMGLPEQSVAGNGSYDPRLGSLGKISHHCCVDAAPFRNARFAGNDWLYYMGAPWHVCSTLWCPVMKSVIQWRHCCRRCKATWRPTQKVSFPSLMQIPRGSLRKEYRLPVQKRMRLRASTVLHFTSDSGISVYIFIKNIVYYTYIYILVYACIYDIYICYSDDVLFSPALKMFNFPLTQLCDFLRLQWCRSCVNSYLRGISLLAATDSYLAPGMQQVGARWVEAPYWYALVQYSVQ